MVMASGILCVDLYSVRQPVLAAIMLWFTAGTWLFLAAVLAQRIRHEPDRFAHEARSPAALTGVAGTCVLGTAFAAHGYYPAAAALLGLGGVSWALLVTPVLRHWQTPATGVSFVLTVATQGLAVPGSPGSAPSLECGPGWRSP
jgi:tellurite resistance protein TehA-like permease